MAELRAVYPAAMVAAERGAEVLLQCRVGRQGVLTGCKVAAETPANEGFGRAALSLSPKFKLHLPARPGDFINAEVRVPVSFAVRDGRVLTGAAEMVEGPSREEVRDATPPDTSTGQATLSCSVMAGGALNACEVTGETPAGRGLGQAAMKLSPRFRVGLWTPDGRPTVGSTALIPFSFDAPPPRLEGPIPQVEFPSWAKMPTAAEMSFIYPQRALRNHRDGDVEMLCTVREDGQVESCRVIKEEPKGQGFGAAALSLTKLFILNPTMVDGRPVMPAGFQVNIPIKFRTW
jgi:TonB family protein